jgi:hypothetical protein
MRFNTLRHVWFKIFDSFVENGHVLFEMPDGSQARLTKVASDAGVEDIVTSISQWLQVLRHPRKDYLIRKYCCAPLMTFV